MDRVLRPLNRALLVLRTEGLPILLRKLKRRLLATPARRVRPPRLLRLAAPLHPLDLTPSGPPRCSVIIPTREPFALTHHCLAALAQSSAATPFETILVDDGMDEGAARRLATYPGLRLLRQPRPMGVAAACLRAAAIARGDYLVLLSPATQVQSGWLDALIETFADAPAAGLVGSRLLDARGRQLAAGAIRDPRGSLRGQGALDDPGRPQYSYRRPVEACLGVALVIETALFRQIGGCAPNLQSADDCAADLASRVHAAGRLVYYQPLSSVVWLGGIETARTPPLWRARGRHSAPTPVPPSSDQGRLDTDATPRRALVIDNYMVMPDRESGSVRMHNLLRILQMLGFRVTFAAANLEAPQPYVAQLQRIGIEVLYRPYVRRIRDHLATRGRDYDLVILSRADAAARTIEAARTFCPQARIVFDTVDLHFLREMRLAELHASAALLRVAMRRRAQELALMRRADLTFVVSEPERALLAREAPDVRVHVVSNIHAINDSVTPFDQRHGLVFIGAFAHPPNTDAVCFLCDQIMPLLRRLVPSVHLSIIGAEPPRAIRARAAADIEILGHVPDVSRYFASCRVAVAPLRYGAGVKGKINQSLAHGLPVVATGIAVEGMHLVDGQSVLVADEPSAFAAAVARLHQDEALWQRLSTAGLRVAEAHFGFAAGERALRAALDLEAPA